MEEVNQLHKGTNVKRKGTAEAQAHHDKRPPCLLFIKLNDLLHAINFTASSQEAAGAKPK